MLYVNSQPLITNKTAMKQNGSDIVNFGGINKI